MTAHPPASTAAEERDAAATVATSVPELLSRAAREVPDRVALVEAASGRRFTWAALDAEVSGVARGFDAMGLVGGYRVVVALPNRVEFVTAYLGALRAGLVVVPVNPRATTGELVRLLADCGARLVLGDLATLTTVRQSVAGLEDALVGADEELLRTTVVPRVVSVGAPTLPGETSYDDLLAAGGDDRREQTRDAERVAVLLYTSGTTGRPRAAMLSHRALLANVAQAAHVEPPMITGDDVVLGVLPLFHVYGLNAVLGQVLHRQARLVLVDGFDTEGSLAVIEDEAVSVVPVAPPVLAYWRAASDLRDRLGAVRLVLSGSAPLAPRLVAEFTERTGIEVHQGYGLTEAAPVVTSTLCSSGPVKPGSVGAALPGVEIRLADEGGAEPEGGDSGEILVRGANVFSGYWPDGVDGPDEAGWFATGDVGFLDEDGDLFLVDRLKDLIVVSGFNVFPTEVEEAVLELAVVAEAGVIGTADERTGEAVVAYVRAASASADPEDVADAVRAHCEVRLARFKRPREVHVVDALPRTVTGKVAKGRLRSTHRRNAGLLE